MSNSARDGKTHWDFWIGRVEFRPAGHDDAIGGLLGFVTFTICDSFGSGGVALRLTRQGRVAFSFPERRDSRGHAHGFFWPLNDAVRQKLEGLLLESLFPVMPSILALAKRVGLFVAPDLRSTLKSHEVTS